MYKVQLGAGRCLSRPSLVLTKFLPHGQLHALTHETSPVSFIRSTISF